MFMMLLGIALSGCSSHSGEIISQDLLNIPKNEAKDISQGKIIVYAVAFKHLNTDLTINKFGIQPSGGGTVSVNAGLSRRINYEEVKRTTSMPAFEALLKQHGFNSLEAFTAKYSSAEPIIPNSDFKAVPKSLGDKLFRFVMRGVRTNGR